MLLNTRIPFSYIFSLVKYKLLFVVIVAGGISYFDKYFAVLGLVFPIIPEWLPGTVGTLITLVLAFRMSQSYDRWWEARKEWGSIVNNSRTLIREVTFLKTTEVNYKLHKEFQVVMIDLLVLWLHSLKDRLRGLPEEHHYLKATQLEVTHGVNLPASILFKMEERIAYAYQNGQLNDYQQVKLTNTVNDLNNAMGKCERIKGTVFPKLYSDTIDFAISFFVVIFPIAFRDPNEYVEFPVVVTVSMVFVLLERLAIGLQNPFENTATDVPMTSIVEGIEAFANEVLKRQNLPKQKTEPSFFQL